MNHSTLCILINEKENKILLGMKKRGFGEGKFNGFGGKPENNEDLHDAAIRELQEEAGLNVSKEQINKVAELDFKFSNKSEWNQLVHVFLAKDWHGEPIESEEMKPKWFNFKEIPFDKKDAAMTLKLFLTN